MSTLEQKKALRLAFMNALYEKTDADENVSVQPPVLAEAMGLEPPETFGFEAHPDHREYVKVIHYLEGERLAERISGEDFSPVTITHRGIIEVENALSNPDRATKYFVPAAMVVNYIGSVAGSPHIQQSGHGSRQSMHVLDQERQGEVAAYVSSLKSEASRLSLDADARRELEAEIATIEAQLASPSPKVPITRAALESVTRILEGVAANAVSSGLIGGAATLINNLPS